MSLCRLTFVVAVGLVATSAPPTTFAVAVFFFPDLVLHFLHVLTGNLI